ncbi:MAG: hypothetical protein KDI04_15140 [Halieaceae bacterium]|nr:hypothetical protein [Halieaceae bacterium]
MAHTGRRTASTWIVMLVASWLVQACSQQQVYDAVQQNRQLECQKLPGTQYEECMKQYSEPYKEYERERQELLREEADNG